MLYIGSGYGRIDSVKRDYLGKVGRVHDIVILVEITDTNFMKFQANLPLQA